jgi:hypothetical protein
VTKGMQIRVLDANNSVSCVPVPLESVTFNDFLNSNSLLFVRLRIILFLVQWLSSSVVDPGSGAFLISGSGIGFFPDPGSQTHIFDSLVTIFLG